MQPLAMAWPPHAAPVMVFASKVTQRVEAEEAPSPLHEAIRAYLEHTR